MSARHHFGLSSVKTERLSNKVIPEGGSGDEIRFSSYCPFQPQCGTVGLRAVSLAKQFT